MIQDSREQLWLEAGLNEALPALLFVLRACDSQPNFRWNYVVGLLAAGGEAVFQGGSEEALEALIR